MYQLSHAVITFIDNITTFSLYLVKMKM